MNTNTDTVMKRDMPECSVKQRHNKTARRVNRKQRRTKENGNETNRRREMRRAEKRGGKERQGDESKIMGLKQKETRSN